MLALYGTVTEWSGGLYVSPSMAGSRAGALIAGAWASMMSLGENGKRPYSLIVIVSKSCVLTLRASLHLRWGHEFAGPREAIFGTQGPYPSLIIEHLLS